MSEENGTPKKPAPVLPPDETSTPTDNTGTDANGPTRGQKPPVSKHAAVEIVRNPQSAAAKKAQVDKANEAIEGAESFSGESVPDFEEAGNMGDNIPGNKPAEKNKKGGIKGILDGIADFCGLD